MNPPTPPLAADHPGLPAVPRPPLGFRSWLVAIVVIFGAVRFGCLFNDLWLDEIWSIRSVERISSPGQILTGLQHDNNHPLNSLFIYLLLPAKADWTYRLLAWFTGTAAIALAGLIARRQYQLLDPAAPMARGQIAGLIAATVFGASYLLIHYSSEARGYGPVVAFGLAALYALLRSPPRACSAWAVPYGVACVLGLLSHAVMFQVLFAGLAWSVARGVAMGWRWRDRLLHLACWHLLPWIFFALYYLTFIRKLEIGGGPHNPVFQVLGELAAYAVGAPASLGVFVGLPVFFAATVFALRLVWRRDRALGCFYAVAIFLAPVAGWWAGGFTLLFPRYFIVSAAGALLLVAHALAWLWNSSPRGRSLSLCAMAVFVLGGGAHTVRLMRYGRGQYQGAIQYVAAHTPTSAISVSSDNDGRNLTVIAYHGGAAGAGRTLNYYASDQLPAEGTQWLFLHQLDGRMPPPRELRIREVDYQLDRIFPHAGLSGWHWCVYRNARR